MACDNGCCNTTPRIVQLPASSALDGGPYTVDLNAPDDGIFRVTDTTSGETFEVDVHQLQCDFFSERLVLDTSASTAGADFGSGTAVTALTADGLTDPGEAAHQAYIDANIDYTAPDGASNSLTPPDTTTAGQTDGGFVEFWVVVPAGTTRTLTWEWAGEGYARLEVAECGAGDYVLADSVWSEIGVTEQITTTLDAGVHLVRVTQVDTGGSSNIWGYVGDPIEFYAASGAAPVVSMQLVAVDCDGNAVDANGDPLVGTLIPMADWPCPISNVIVEAGNIVGELFTVNAGTTAAAGDDANGSAAVEVGETLHFYQGAPGEPLLVTEGSGIVRLPNDEAQCGIPGEEELIAAAAGALADGTTYAVTGGTSLDFGATTPGDIRWNGTITLTFSNPVNLILRPTTAGDPVILDPLMWSYQNGQLPTHTSATRFESVDGLPLIVDSPNGEVLEDGQIARGNNPDSAGVVASDPWGTVTAPAGTEFTFRARSADAVNISAAPLEIAPICEVTADIYSRLTDAEPGGASLTGQEIANLLGDPGVDLTPLLSGEEGQTARIGDDLKLYSDPSTPDQCYLERGAPVISGVTYDNSAAANVGQSAHQAWVNSEFRVDLTPETDPLETPTQDWELDRVVMTRPGAPFNASNNFNLQLRRDGVAIATSTGGSLTNAGPTTFTFVDGAGIKPLPTDEWRFVGAGNQQGGLYYTPDTDDRFTLPGDDATLQNPGNGFGPFLVNAGPDLGLPMEFFFNTVDVTEHRVSTYDDGEGPKLVEFDDNGDPIELAQIPAGWTSCGGLQAAGLTAADIQAAQNDYALVDETCYRELVDAPLAGSEFTLDERNLVGETNPTGFPGGGNAFQKSNEIVFDPSALPFGARIKGMTAAFGRYGNNTAAAQFTYKGQVMQFTIGDIAGGGNNLTDWPDQSQEFATSQLIEAAEVMTTNIMANNKMDERDGPAYDFIASATNGFLNATAVDGTGGAPLVGLNAAFVFELSETNIYTVRTYRDQNGIGPDITLDGNGSPIVVDPAWEVCPEDGLNATQIAEVQELVDAGTDPASAEVGNLIVEGDDGEEYALPLKSEACYDETLAPTLLANFDATDPNDDFAIDDQFFTVSNNTGADQELGAVQFVTDGAWPATGRTISFAGGGLSGSVVVPGGTPSGTTITVPLDTPVTVVDGGTQSIQLTTSDFSGAQGTGVANAMVFGGIVRHMVRTYSDGETDKVIDFDVNGEPQELASIPAEWVPCPVFDQDAIDAIKQQIIDCQVVTTECYVEVEGVLQRDAEGEDTGGLTLPTTLLFPSTASGAGTAGDIIVHFNDVGATPLVEIELTIIADGVPVETRTDERTLGGVSELFRFGYFEFQAGVEYELLFETPASNINLYGTINPVSDDGITFPVGTNAAFGIPQIRIVSPGESEFRVVTDAQGVVTAYNAAGDVVPATLGEWMLCPLDTTERAEVERLIAETVCPSIGVTEVLEQIGTSGPTLGGPGTPVAPAVATTLSQGATGQTRTTIVPFHGRLPGETFDVIVRVTRLSAGGGGIVLQPSGAFSNTSGATDHDIEFELADGQVFRWAVFPASAGGAEAFQFLTQPVVEYAQGAGAPALTLPFNGSWSNGNNSASSGFGFDASTVLNFRSLGTAGAGSSFQVALREVPTFPEQTPCDRSAGMLDYVNDEVAASAPAAQFRVANTPGGVSITGVDLSAGKSTVLIAVPSEQTQINIPASIFTAANVGQSVTVLINSTLGGQSPEITSEDVEGDGGNGVFAFEDSFELFSAGVGFGYVIPHRG